MDSDSLMTLPSWLMVMLITSLLAGSLMHYNRSEREFIQSYVTQVANNASDAALLETQLNLQIDVMGDTIIDPSYAYSMYDKIFRESLEVNGSAAIAKFADNIAAMILADDDGYYIYMPFEKAYDYVKGFDRLPAPALAGQWFDQEYHSAESTNDHATMNKLYSSNYFTQKIPYARFGTYPTNYVICDTFSGTNILYGTSAGVWKRGNIYENPELESYELHDQSEIVKEIVGAVTYSVEKANESQPYWGNKFYIPSQFLDDTLYSAVSLQGVTLITLIQGFDYKGIKDIDIYTVSGTQLTFGKKYVVYMRGGKRYYTTADMLPPGVTVIQTHPSAEDAVRYGRANPDPSYYRPATIK